MDYDKAKRIQESYIHSVKESHGRVRFYSDSENCSLFFDIEDWQYKVLYQGNILTFNSQSEVFDWLINAGFIDNKSGDLHASRYNNSEERKMK